MLVKANYFELELDCENNNEWIQYKVEIIPAVRQRIPDTGELKIGPKLRGGSPVSIDIERGSELSRRILRQLNKDIKKDLGIMLAHDGSSTAFAPKELFEGDTKEYPVTVKRDCDSDEPDAEWVKNSHFLVQLSHPIRIITTKVQDFEPIRRAIDIIIKSAMLTVGMKAFGRNPRAFYFPEQDQRQVINIQNHRGLQLENMLKNDVSSFVKM